MRIRVAFVAVDPERDTTTMLERYLANFNPSIVGLTGTPAEIAAAATAFRAVYQKVPKEGGVPPPRPTQGDAMNRRTLVIGTGLLAIGAFLGAAVL